MGSSTRGGIREGAAKGQLITSAARIVVAGACKEVHRVPHGHRHHVEVRLAREQAGFRHEKIQCPAAQLVDEVVPVA